MAGEITGFRAIGESTVHQVDYNSLANRPDISGIDSEISRISGELSRINTQVLPNIDASISSIEGRLANLEDAPGGLPTPLANAVLRTDSEGNVLWDYGTPLPEASDGQLFLVSAPCGGMPFWVDADEVNSILATE